MTRRLVLQLAAAAMVLPAIAVVYGLWHEGVVADEALLAWMLLPIIGTVFAVDTIKNNLIVGERLRRGYWSVLAGQAVGLALGLYSAAMLREAAPLWGVAGVSLLMLAAWVWFAVAKSRPQASPA